MPIETEPRRPHVRHSPGAAPAAILRCRTACSWGLAALFLGAQAGCMSALTTTTLREALRETAASMSASHELDHATRTAPSKPDDGSVPDAAETPDDLGAGAVADDGMDTVIDNAVARLSAAGGIDAATQQLLIQTLENTPPQDWAVVVNEFAATLEESRGITAREAAANRLDDEPPPPKPVVGGLVIPVTTTPAAAIPPGRIDVTGVGAIAITEAAVPPPAAADTVPLQAPPAVQANVPVQAPIQVPVQVPDQVPVQAPLQPPVQAAVAVPAVAPVPAPATAQPAVQPASAAPVQPAIALIEPAPATAPGAVAVLHTVVTELLSPPSPPEPEAFADPPAPAAERAGSAGPAIQNPCFATRVRGWGQVERFPAASFRPGQEVIVYFELEGLRIRSAAEGHTTAVDSDFRLLDASGERVGQWTFEPIEETCPSPRRDYFVRYFIRIPESAKPGPHRLEWGVTDAVAGSTRQAHLDLEVVAAP